MHNYLQLLRHIAAEGVGHDDRTGVGTVSCFDGSQLKHEMALGFPLLTTKRLPFRWIAEELFWMLSGSTDERELRARGVDIWQEWATSEQCARFGRLEGDLGPVYGELWRNFGGDYVPIHHRTTTAMLARPGIDQIARLMEGLLTQPNSRRLIVSGWNPAQCDDVALPPCHTLWQVKVDELGHQVISGGALQNRVLHLHLYARSIDAFLGLPFNIAFYALLLKLLAHVTDMGAGRLIITFGDVHIYRNHAQQVETQLSREPKSLPTVVINERLRGMGLEGLLSARYEDLTLLNYNPWPKIPAPVAI